MFRFIVALSLLLLLGLAFSQDLSTARMTYLAQYRAAEILFRKAEQISLSANYTDEIAAQEETLNRQALAGFKKILPHLINTKDDSLAFYCFYKIGVLQHYFDSLTLAKENYEKAIRIQSRVPALADSLLFKPYLFVGGIQYTLNQFDSALIHYKKAETIANKYNVPLDGTNRLFNTLGAIYFETGNYSQAKNYFQKAIALLGTINSANEGLLINYQINLAATFTRLEKYDEANTIYQNLLKQEINKNDILHNLGTINLRLGAARKALNYFRQVNYNNNKIVRLKNDIGQAYENIGQKDSALAYYHQAIGENEKWNRKVKNVQAGLTLKLLGDVFYNKGEPVKALEKYQLAIIQLVNDFNDTDIFRNPTQFNTAFSYINLFNLLTAKADGFAKLYEQKKETKALQAALDAYKTAFELADYVERTYESDEARLFLNKIKYTAHSKPIDISLQLFDLTKEKKFLEDAYGFDQRNKASILSLNVEENEWKNQNSHNSELFDKQIPLKSAITRLSLKASQTTDSVQLQNINATIRDNEIELGKIQDKINADPSLRTKQGTERIPPVKIVQKKLDKNSALLSYHLSENRLLILVITNREFNYHVTDIDKSFFLQIDSFRSALYSPGQNKSSGLLSFSLYQKLIGEIGDRLTDITRLVIIPDDELHYLPFEALQYADNTYLVQKFAIQYQYSTALFEQPGSHPGNNKTLAFAPFANQGFVDSAGNSLTRLSFSGEEVASLDGRILIDSSATKTQFLQTADQFGIIHLATHASVNNESPLRSFVSFFPANQEEYGRLYAGEIYNLDLNSTHLVILSACETGTGQLIKGEGLMSLSRAFAYAGCPNIITSLWKAEDRTTAFISRKIHDYLQKGYTRDKALQQAKLDLLNNHDIDPRFKSPNYWAHLVLIGQYEPGKTHRSSWWIVVLVILLSVIAFQFTRRKLPRS